MKKITRNMSTPAREVQSWPDWKRAGVNAAQLRDTPRTGGISKNEIQTALLHCTDLAEHCDDEDVRAVYRTLLIVLDAYESHERVQKLEGK
jgi:hypothetical protein